MTNIYGDPDTFRVLRLRSPLVCMAEPGCFNEPRYMLTIQMALPHEWAAFLFCCAEHAGADTEALAEDLCQGGIMRLPNESSEG